LASQKDVALPVSQLAGQIWQDSAAALSDDMDFNRITELTASTNTAKAGE
ncbi:MAG: NAD(P)-dependent oxidoreductase, partial [Thalassospira sp.]|nr:NAD(P)-dependent oxidoreductase [Thalassospira sp.]